MEQGAHAVDTKLTGNLLNSSALRLLGCMCAHHDDCFYEGSALLAAVEAWQHRRAYTSRVPSDKQFA
jgi:hypothetical protein